jgi:hypothetical protein
MVAFIQGTWLYLSGIQADEAQLAIFDSRSVQQKQEATRAKRYSTYLSTSKMEGTKHGGNRIQFPYTSYLTTQKK